MAPKDPPPSDEQATFAPASDGYRTLRANIHTELECSGGRKRETYETPRPCAPSQLLDEFSNAL
jgi:hypothetical protein